MVEQKFFGESHEGEVLHARIYNFTENRQEIVYVALLNNEGLIKATYNYVKPFPDCFFNMKDLIIEAGLIKDDRRPDCPWG